jgi:hypothetical protein
MRKQPVTEQARLAMSLAESLGRESAIHVCRANGWDGVLDYLLDELDDEYPDQPKDGSVEI